MKNTIKTFNAVYTGGNIYIFHGELEDGNFFLTSDEGYTTILDESAEDLDESLYDEWQDEHRVEDLEGDELKAFLTELHARLKEEDFLSDGELKWYADCWEINQPAGEKRNVKEVEVYRAIGGFWAFYGEFDNGNGFFTGENGKTIIFDKTTDDLLELTDNSWQKKHTIKVLSGEELTAFHDEMMNKLLKTNGRDITDDEIHDYLWSWSNSKSEDLPTYFEWEEVVPHGIRYKRIESNYCESSEITFLMEYTFRADGSPEFQEVIGFYYGEPTQEHTKYYSTTGRGTTATFDEVR